MYVSVIVCNHGAIYTFEKTLQKYSVEINTLRVHRHMRECTLEFNFERLGW